MNRETFLNVKFLKATYLIILCDISYFDLFFFGKMVFIDYHSLFLCIRTTYLHVLLPWFWDKFSWKQDSLFLAYMLEYNNNVYNYLARTVGCDGRKKIFSLFCPAYISFFRGTINSFVRWIFSRSGSVRWPEIQPLFNWVVFDF